MKAFALILIVFIGLPLRAQNTEPSADDLISAAEQWAKENLDEDALRVLRNVDREKVKALLEQIQKEFESHYVLDLGALKQTAQAVIPLLEQYEETLPYALWLKTRLDYLEVADEFRALTPSPKPPPGQPAKPAPNPPPQKERELWARKVAQRPWPANAKPYVSRLKPIFAAEHVPEQLVWVAEVESSFDPRARSPAGAAGLFQLMPATAQRYGLRTMWPFDQRVKPEPSARAAAQYLQYLHARFGDWRLALAAYNCGEGAVRDLLRRHKAKSYDAIATRLPAETQLYVPKVEAMIFRREGIRLSDLRPPAQTG